MILDFEQDRQLLLAIINQAQFKGEIVEHVSDLKRRLSAAKISAPILSQPDDGDVKDVRT